MPTENKYTPHIHAEAIKAWADGKPIQGHHKTGFDWLDEPDPKWNLNWQYRVKPEEVVDYTVVFDSGIPGAKFSTAKEEIRQFYGSIKDKQGFMKRTTVDGKVVSLEFIPK